MHNSKLDPKLNFLLNENIVVQLQYRQELRGVLRGYDQFMNLVIEDTVLRIEKKKKFIGKTLVRGSVVQGIELKGSS
jgi:small nuclear ribonucleoprotein (snRNP)-like protein